MSIISTEVEVIPAGKMIQYYKNKGYNPKNKQPLIIDVTDLSNNSHQIIKVKCDICGKEKDSIYQNYFKITNGLTTPYYCSECAPKKVEKNCMKKYGVSNHSKRPEVIQKIQNTFQTKYGVNHAMEIPEIRDRIKENTIAKYGVSNVMYIPEFREQAKIKQQEYLEEHKNEHYEQVRQTNIDRYGVPSPFMLPGVREKIIKTNLNKYGCEYPMQNKEIREKIRISMYKNGSVPTSKQQKYLNELYKGELNFPLKMYNLDIYLPNEKINVEFDGSGHKLSQKLGTVTEEEFNRKEIIRNTAIKNAGIKQMRIISTTDKLPSDQILLDMLQHARNYFSQYPSHSWINYNLDSSSIYSAEYKDGIPYNYGQLRTIKEDDLKTA